MPTTRLRARCRRCDGDFILAQLGEERTGSCPRCGRNLSPDWTAHLVEQAARAEIAHRHLVDALRELRNLPGDVIVRPGAIFHNLFEEVGWQRQLGAEQELLRDELDALQRHVARWEDLVGRPPARREAARHVNRETPRTRPTGPTSKRVAAA
jgi:hypothetical protein